MILNATGGQYDGSTGRQIDGSIVDIYGNRITRERALGIVTAVHALPAQLARDDFLHAIENAPIVIVQGETGSGKSTQLPKFAHLANPNSRIVLKSPQNFLFPPRTRGLAVRKDEVFELLSQDSSGFSSLFSYSLLGSRGLSFC